METPKRVAGMIASVVQSTQFLKPAWDALTEKAKQEIMADWVGFIEADIEGAAELIVEDIASRPELSDAWSKLPERAHLSRHHCFAFLVTKAKP